MCRFEAGQGYECMAELQQATRCSGHDVIRAWTKFIGSYLSHILRRPLAIYQLASQQVYSYIESLHRQSRYALQPVCLSGYPSAVCLSIRPANCPTEASIKAIDTVRRQIWYNFFVVLGAFGERILS